MQHKSYVNRKNEPEKNIRLFLFPRRKKKLVGPFFWTRLWATRPYLWKKKESAFFEKIFFNSLGQLRPGRTTKEDVPNLKRPSESSAGENGFRMTRKWTCWLVCAFFPPGTDPHPECFMKTISSRKKSEWMHTTITTRRVTMATSSLLNTRKNNGGKRKIKVNQAINWNSGTCRWNSISWRETRTLVLNESCFCVVWFQPTSFDDPS